MLCMGVLATLAMTACKNGDEYSTWGTDKNEVSFTSSIGDYATRATGTTWEAGDAIGVYMTATGQGIANATKSNVKYTTTGGGAFTAASEVLYYPSDGSAVDFTAYYPYSASLTGTTVPVSVADQSSQAAIDLLAATATGASATSAAPALAFTHQLSNIVINLTAGNGVSSTAGVKVILSGTNTTGSFDLSSLTLTQNSSVANINFVTATDGSKAEAIVLPREAAAGATILFVLGTDSFTYTIPSTTAFAKGTKTTYNAALTKTTTGETSVTITGATITDWTTTPGGSIDVNFGETTTPTPPVVVPPVVTPGTTETIFLEEFGTTVSQITSGSSTVWPSVDVYTGWTNQNLTFTDPLMTGTFSRANIRTTTKLTSPHLWFAAKYASELLISGISTTGYTSLTLSYDIATNTANTDQNVIEVHAGTTAKMTEQTVPSSVMTTTNTFQTVTIEGLPTDLTSIAFISLAEKNTVGIRIDNIKLVGTK